MKRKALVAGAVALGVLGLIAVWLWPLEGRKVLRRWFGDMGRPAPERFHDPEGLAIDPAGNIYVADEDSGTFWMLDREGRTLFSATALEGLDIKLTTGDSLVAWAPGRLVAISGYHSLIELEVVDGKPKHVRTISRRGKGAGEFEDPEGLSRDANGDLYASNEDFNNILVFDAQGKHLRTLAMPHDPEGVCVFEDRLYVTFSKDGYVGCYSKDGARRFDFGRGVVNEPDFVIVGPDRELYVTDKRGAKIEVFDLEGKPLRRIGGFGREPGLFDDPEDLAFDLDGNLVVADGGNRRIQVLTREGKPIRVIK